MPEMHDRAVITWYRESRSLVVDDVGSIDRPVGRSGSETIENFNTRL